MTAPSLILCFFGNTWVFNSGIAKRVTAYKFVINYIKDSRTAKDVGSAEQAVTGSMLQCVLHFTSEHSMLCRTNATEQAVT